MANAKRSQSSIQILTEILGGLIGGIALWYVGFKILEKFFEFGNTGRSALGWAILLVVLGSIPVVASRWYRIAGGTSAIVILVGLLLGGFASLNPIINDPQQYRQVAHTPAYYLALGAWFAAATAWRPLPQKEESVDFSRPPEDG